MSFSYLTAVPCFRCSGNNIVHDYKAGDIICRDCGEVLSDRVIDEGNEVKHYADDDDPHKVSRTSGLAESIGSLHTSFITNSEIVKKTLERAQRFSSDQRELQALSSLNIVSEMCSRMDLIASIKVSFSISVFFGVQSLANLICSHPVSMVDPGMHNEQSVVEKRTSSLLRLNMVNSFSMRTVALLPIAFLWPSLVENTEHCWYYLTPYVPQKGRGPHKSQILFSEGFQV